MPELQSPFSPSKVDSKTVVEKDRPRSGSSADADAGGRVVPLHRNARSKSWLYLIVAAAIAGAVFYWSYPAVSHANAADSATESTWALETFVVNLEGPGQQRAYLRVGITLGLTRTLPRNRDDVPVAALRDAILEVLAETKAEQLLTAEGKEHLKNDLLGAVRGRVPQMEIKHVYFTEFLVQM